MADHPKRLRVVDRGKTDFFAGYRVYQDTVTDVLYLYVSEGYGAGLTVLVDKDGKPLTALDNPGAGK